MIVDELHYLTCIASLQARHIMLPRLVMQPAMLHLLLAALLHPMDFMQNAPLLQSTAAEAPVKTSKLYSPSGCQPMLFGMYTLGLLQAVLKKSGRSSSPPCRIYTHPQHSR